MSVFIALARWDAAEELVMSDEPSCRLQRIQLGLSYPKRSCQQCGTMEIAGWICDYDRRSPVYIAKVEAENASLKAELEALQTQAASASSDPVA